MQTYQIPIVAAGKVIEDYSQTHRGRFGADFQTPDPNKYFDQLVLQNRFETMRPLYDMSLHDILEYLLELGTRLNINHNEHLQLARELSRVFSDLSDDITDMTYVRLPFHFTKEFLEDAIAVIGRKFLEGWVDNVLYEGKICSVRPFGVPTAHVIAGNGNAVGAITLIRNALIRGHAIVKIPSNELGMPVALARTMIDMAPDHPITKAFNVAYWKGGDETFETKLYHPGYIDRIVAWGGAESIKHIAKYIQPGIDLCNFDPKNSRAIIGKEAYDSEASLREVAKRLAADVGYINQVGCLSCRVAYIESGTDDQGLEKAKKLADLVYEELQNLPHFISQPAKDFDPQLKAKIHAISFMDDEYYTVGGRELGGVIVSLSGEEIDFAEDLSGRTVNLIPADNIDDALRGVHRDVQSIGVYPESLKDVIAVDAALQGAQRLTSLGYMTSYSVLREPHDGTEGMRRMATWVVKEDCMTNFMSIPWRVDEDGVSHQDQFAVG
jgi:hypothetical protein